MKESLAPIEFALWVENKTKEIRQVLDGIVGVGCYLGCDSLGIYGSICFTPVLQPHATDLIMIHYTEWKNNTIEDNNDLFCVRLGDRLRGPIIGENASEIKERLQQQFITRYSAPEL